MPSPPLPPLQPNHPLLGRTSLNMPAQAAAYLELPRAELLPQAWQTHRLAEQPVYVLGGGSNVLLTKDPAGLVLHLADRSRHATPLPDGRVRLRVGAGHNWHQLVCHTTAMGWWGLENLALIPGHVGAAPVQNIGAYGRELSDVLEAVDAFDLHTGRWHHLPAADCGLGYRDSRFKGQDAGRFIIARVHLLLNTQPTPHLAYQGLADALADLPPAHLTPHDVAEAVMAIRQTKLPDPHLLPNAGSFFQNPIVPQASADALKAKHPGMPLYPAGMGQAKLSAGWLIEQAGWKGHRDGPVGVYDHHALVLVHHGGGTGQQLWALAQAIKASVRQRFGVDLQPEVRVW